MGKIPAEWGDSRLFCLNPIFPPQYSAKLGMTREHLSRGSSPKDLASCTFILDAHLVMGIDLKSHYAIQVSSV